MSTLTSTTCFRSYHLPLLLFALDNVQMDNLYYARLSREPVEKSRPPAVPQDLADHTFRILPIPASQPGNPASMDGKPIELHVPAIHIHHDQTPTPDDHAPTGPALSSEGPAVQVQQGGFWSRVGVKKPHPFLWISLLLSLIALVLEVPKGSLPTLTGRHKALRVSLSCPRSTRADSVDAREGCSRTTRASHSTLRLSASSVVRLAGIRR